jgi:YidC/Oxa1 family membrane protein insertase
VSQDNNPNFFDARTIMAVILIATTFVGWQYYMSKKYPEAYAKKTVTTVTEEAGKKVAPAPGTSEAQAAKPEARDDKPPSVASSEEKLTHFENDKISLDISSRGMGVKNYKVKKYKDRAGETVHLGFTGETGSPFETRLLGRKEAIDFNVEKVGDKMFVGRARVGQLEITKTMEIQPEDYAIVSKVSTKGSDDSFIGLTTVLSEDVEEPGKKSFFLPQLDHQEFYVDTTETHDRVAFHKDKDESKAWSKVRLASVGSQYFTQAVVDKSPILPEAKGEISHAGKLAYILLNYPVLDKTQGIQLEYLTYMGPKSHDLLARLDVGLSKVVNFGFFNFIGSQILALLHFFFGLVGNWGIAIILLTLVARTLVLPFNLYSYKSMKAMQAIQPKIQALRERYKDDQAKQQQQIMALMRENKVNPLGGCLPVLFQFPIFIALYQVLGNSIELYQAPFGLWIHDLSLKDPYYILPVLMGVTMFIQQKITPNTMDPAQAKMMLMMPLIFTFFMISLPSGLTLYMWIGAIFGVCQQMYFMRDRKKSLQTA